MLKVEKIDYCGCKAYQLENEYVIAVILPQVGGRIISFSDKEEELLYSVADFKERLLDISGIDNIKEYRENLRYIPLGGYKTWLAPQNKWRWPPYLDLAVGEFEFNYYQTEDRIKFDLVSHVCRETEMQLTRTIVLERGAKSLKIGQGMKNCSLKSKYYGLWDVTQVLGNGKVILPLSSEKEINNLMGEEVKESIDIIEVNNNYYGIINCSGEKIFKVGTPFSAGWILSILDRDDRKVGYFKKFPVFRDVEFGHGCAVEVFDTCKFNYFEVEIHGPLSELVPEEETGFVEEWRIYTWSKARSIESIIKELIT